MGIMKKIASLSLTAVLCLNGASLGTVAYAKVISSEEQMKIYESNRNISESMRYILENYVGDEVSVDELYDAAMHGMMDALDDYSVYFSEKELEEFVKYFSAQSYGIGIMYNYNYDGNLIVNRVYKDSPADKVGIKKNDIITKINGTTVKRKYWDEIEKLFAIDKNGSKITITNGKETKEVYAKFAEYKIPTVFVNDLDEKAEKQKNNATKNTRYIEITSISEETADEFKTAIEKLQAEGVKKIILDLRGNGGGFLDVAVDICNTIVPRGNILTTVDKMGKKTSYTSSLDKKPFEKMLVLVDSNTASAAEVIAGALQDSKSAVIIGEKTYGKGVVQSMNTIDGKSGIKLTTEKYFRRSGVAVNKIGITPDIKIETIEVVFDEIDIELGKSNNDLIDVKKALKLLGYGIASSDNIMDISTIEAIKKFQTARGNNATGKIDEGTLLDINIELYLYYLKNDLVLNRAYTEILK